MSKNIEKEIYEAYILLSKASLTSYLEKPIS